MHPQPADRVHALATALVLAAAHLRREAHCLGTPALPGKLCRVMKNEDRAVAGDEPTPRRVEMAPKNIFFAHPVVGEEAVGRLRVGPVLTGQRYRLSEPGIHALDQLTKATVQQAVAKTAARKLLVEPPLLHDPNPFVPDSVPDRESRSTSNNTTNCGNALTNHQDVGD